MNDNNNTITKVQSTDDQTYIDEITQLTLELAMIATENQGEVVDKNLIGDVAKVVVDNQKIYDTGVESDNLKQEIPNRDNQDSSNQGEPDNLNKEIPNRDDQDSSNQGEPDNLKQEIPNRDDQDSSNQKSLLENIIEDSSKNLKHARESFLECFIPNLSSNKDTELNDQSKEQSQPSSVIKNIGNDFSIKLKSTQDNARDLGGDLTKLFMLDRLFKGNNDSQNR